MDEEDLDLGEQTGESDDGGAAAASESAAEQHDSSRAVERQRNLEEALLLQMDMQKRLHEQLEVSCLPAGPSTCPDLLCIWHTGCPLAERACAMPGHLCWGMRLPPASPAILCTAAAIPCQDVSLPVPPCPAVPCTAAAPHQR